MFLKRGREKDWVEARLRTAHIRRQSVHAHLFEREHPLPCLTDVLQEVLILLLQPNQGCSRRNFLYYIVFVLLIIHAAKINIFPHISTSAVGRCANKSMNAGFFVGNLGKLVVPPQLEVHFLHLRVGLQVVGHLVRGENGYVIPRRLRLAEIGLRGRKRIT